jgi:hypothetical protein
MRLPPYTPISFYYFKSSNKHQMGDPIVVADR